MRTRDEFGIPESSEFIEELDEIYASLEERMFQSKLNREEQVVIDVYEAIGGIEGNGLHQFWGWEAQERILESFRMLGANGVADSIEKCRWVTKVLAKGVDSEGHYRFTKGQESQIDEIEEQVYEMFIGLPTKLLDSAHRHAIKG